MCQPKENTKMFQFFRCFSVKLMKPTYRPDSVFTLHTQFSDSLALCECNLGGHVFYYLFLFFYPPGKHLAACIRSFTADRLQLDCTNKCLTKWNGLKFGPHLFLFLLLLLFLRPALIREFGVGGCGHILIQA